MKCRVKSQPWTDSIARSTAGFIRMTNAKQQLLSRQRLASLSEKSQQERDRCDGRHTGSLAPETSVPCLRDKSGKGGHPRRLYKYIPKGHRKRSTKQLARDPLERRYGVQPRNKDGIDRMSTPFLALAQSKLGLSLPWEEVLDRRTSYSDLRLTTFDSNTSIHGWAWSRSRPTSSTLRPEHPAIVSVTIPKQLDSDSVGMMESLRRTP